MEDKNINKLKQYIKEVLLQTYNIDEVEAEQVVENSPLLEKSEISKYHDYDSIEDWIEDIYVRYMIKEALKDVELMQEGKVPERTIEDLFINDIELDGEEQPDDV